MIRAGLLLLVLLCLWPNDAEAQSCSYAPSPTLDFGTSIGAPTVHRDFTTTISVTCTGLLALLNVRACLSIPAGSGGISIADRRLANGGNTVQYQIYTNVARSQIWGALGGSAPPLAVDFPALGLVPITTVVTLYGRVFGPQAGVAVGTYTSVLTPIQSRIATYVLLFPPSCSTLNTTAATVGSITAQLKIDPACSIAATPLGFGTVTNLATVSPAATNLSVTCTSGRAYSVALDGGESGNVNARRMTIDAGSDVINYQLYRPTGVPNVWGNTTGVTLAGTGTGSPQSLQVHGVVLPAQGPKPTGTYRDTITATITF